MSSDRYILLYSIFLTEIITKPCRMNVVNIQAPVEEAGTTTVGVPPLIDPLLVAHGREWRVKNVEIDAATHVPRTTSFDWARVIGVEFIQSKTP